jgi:hypothetical protein
MILLVLYDRLTDLGTPLPIYSDAMTASVVVTQYRYVIIIAQYYLYAREQTTALLLSGLCVCVIDAVFNHIRQETRRAILPLGLFLM